MNPVILAVAHPDVPAGGGTDPAWIVALIALITAAFGCLAWIGRWAWRIARRVTHFLDDYFGQPARDGMPAKPGVMARLASVEQLVAQVVAETQPNHGQSLRDVVHHTAEAVTELRQRIEELDSERAGREGKT